MREDLTRVFSTNKPFEEELVKNLFDEAGIEWYCLNKKDSSYIFGETEIYVAPEQESQALRILADRELL